MASIPPGGMYKGPPVHLMDPNVLAQLLKYRATVQGKIYLKAGGGQPANLVDFQDAWVTICYYTPPTTGSIVPVPVSVGSAQAVKDSSGQAWGQYTISMTGPSSLTNPSPAFLTEELEIGGYYNAPWSGVNLGSGMVFIIPKDPANSKFKLTDGELLVVDMQFNPQPVT